VSNSGPLSHITSWQILSTITQQFFLLLAESVVQGDYTDHQTSTVVFVAVIKPKL